MMTGWKDFLFHICICLFHCRIIIFMALGYLFPSILPFVLSHLIIHFPSLFRPKVWKNTSIWCAKLKKSGKSFRHNHSYIPEGKRQNNIAKVWISDELFRILDDMFFTFLLSLKACFCRFVAFRSHIVGPDKEK